MIQRFDKEYVDIFIEVSLLKEEEEEVSIMTQSKFKKIMTTETVNCTQVI